MTTRSETRWSPQEDVSRAEELVLARMTRVGKLFRFLRLHRLDLFDESFQEKLSSMYKDTPRGRPPCPPAMLAAATILQAYTGVSDAEAVERAVFDRRWQMVLDCHGCEEPPFSQGALCGFRFRLIAHDMDRELVARTVDLAKTTKGFGYKNLRVALDSAPIWGAGRVEDTFNLIGHALMVCVACAADDLGTTVAALLEQAALKVVGKSSVKAALDIDWDDHAARRDALNRLVDDVDRFATWAGGALPDEMADEESPLAKAWKQLQGIVNQDLEPDPDGEGKRIIDGTTRDRQVSISDPEMRHGRKSKSKTINGYKGHIARELDHGLILDALVLPANQKEYIAADLMRPYIESIAPVAELHFDRGYLPATWVVDLYESDDARVYSKPWNPSNQGFFKKSAFAIDLEARVVTCPGGEAAPIPAGGRARKDGRRQVWFRGCASCALKDKCTKSERGRSITLHENEALLQHLAAERATPEGRAKLRERTAIEHALAHVRTYQPHQARYLGARSNTFGMRRAAVVVNLQTIDRCLRDQANRDPADQELRLAS